MVCQRSRMSGPSGPMLREGAGRPATRSRACGLRPYAKRRRRLGTKRDDPLDRAATILRIALEQLLDLNVRFADLVVMAERLHPIPFRTRP